MHYWANTNHKLWMLGVTVICSVKDSHPKSWRRVWMIQLMMALMVHLQTQRKPPSRILPQRPPNTQHFNCLSIMLSQQCPVTRQQLLVIHTPTKTCRKLTSRPHLHRRKISPQVYNVQQVIGTLRQVTTCPEMWITAWQSQWHCNLLQWSWRNPLVLARHRNHALPGIWIPTMQVRIPGPFSFL